MRRMIPLLAILIAALLPNVQALAQIIDRIYDKDGRVILAGQRITVVGETYKEVRYEIEGGASGAFPQSRVKEIMFGDRPPDYRAAEEHRKRYEYAQAVEAYEKAFEATRGREWWVKPYSLYYMAFCSLQAGKTKDAKKHYERLMKEYPTARFYPNAQIDLGDIHLREKDYEKALASFRVVSDVDPATGGPVFDKDLYFLAQLKAVEAHIRKKEFDEARSKLSALMQILPPTYIEMTRSAKLKQALITIATGKIEQGVSEYRIIIGQIIDQMNRAGAEQEIGLMRDLAQCYNGLGDAFLENTGRKERHKEALMEYLRVVTVMAESVDLEYAHALKGAANCFEAIGKKEDAAALRKELKTRFRGYR